MKLKQILISLLAPGILCLALSACGKTAVSSQSVSFYAMDTLMSLTAAGKNADTALQEAEERINTLEHTLSVTRSESEIVRLNESGALTLSSDTAALIERALSLCERTDGNFDISVNPAVKAWGFYTEEYRIPTEEELDSLRDQIDYHSITVDGSTVTLSPNQGIDLGAIAKGYASEEACRIFRENNISSALIVLGGSVQTLGAKSDGSLWRIGIQNPDGSDNYLGVWTGKDRCLVTSGDYQRYFETDGVRYHHILDPHTAAPAQSDLRSVTVISEDPVAADALSTALFVMGSERALDFYRAQGDFELVLYTSDGRLLITKGLADSFESDYAVEVVE